MGSDSVLPTAIMEKYKRLLRYTTTISYHRTGRIFLNIARDILQVSLGENTALSKEIYSLLTKLFPSRVSVFTDNFFSMPPFPVRVLMNTVNL